MARPRFRTNVEVCGDCNAAEPCWASVNRGVYMCNDCAGVHRSLGRHVSQVKHLQRSVWHQNQLNMVNQLVLVGANSIWEHSLLDPAQMRSGKRKPNSSDPVHPNKSEFIRAKYEQLAYVNRPPWRDDEDLGKQLHASVRTANLDTSLRLLSVGAHANFYHSEKGNTPLHVAAKAGQALQVELLVTFGADPAGVDNNRQTPEDLARAEGHHELADRLVELQYELSDRLSHYAWRLKPDHKLKNHYAIPKSRDNGVGLDGRKKLQALSNHIFEELAMDVFDEVDRRETEQIWQEVKHSGSRIPPTADHAAVPFLTVNPDYSTTRNQGRQKLGRFTPHEFTVLITDILYDIVRRQSLSGGCPMSTALNQQLNSEDPIYDLPPDGTLDFQSIEKSAARPNQTNPTVPVHEFLALKKKLSETEDEVSKLQELNRDLSNKVTNLAKLNHELLKQKQQITQYSSAFKPTDRQAATVSSKPPTATSNQLHPKSGVVNSITRPTSVFNPNENYGSQSSLTSVDGKEQRRRTIHETQHGEIVSEPHATNVHPTFPTDKDHEMSKQSAQTRNGSPHNSAGSDYDNNIKMDLPTSTRKGSPGSTDGTMSPGSGANGSNSNENNNTAADKRLGNNSPALVAGTDVKTSVVEQKDNDYSGASRPLLIEDKAIRKKTETVTRNITNLVQAGQRNNVDGYLNCSENIFIAVQEIVALFPESPDDEELSAVIIKLSQSAEKLRNRCREVIDQGINTKQVMEETVKNAYDVAKAEKVLVTMTTKVPSENAA